MPYYPYLRGRQYELLTVKDLLTSNRLTSQVCPIIEPVKATPQLLQLIQLFKGREGYQLGIVLNPAVGDLTARVDLDEQLHIYSDGDQTLLFDDGQGDILPVVLLNNDAIRAAQHVNQHDDTLLESKGIVFVTDNDRARIKQLIDLPFHAIATSGNDRINRDLERNKVSGLRISFSDPFIKRENNAAYAEEGCQDEFFSDDHLAIMETTENTLGFGDYTIIGDNYNEHGGMPKAVAIHIVYFDSDWALRIHHFVSHASNDSHETPAKFVEAAQQLRDWWRDYQTTMDPARTHMTYGLETLIRYAEAEAYPGLPMIKKLSMMHHLELMGWFLAERPDR